MLASSDQADEDVVPEALSVQVVVLKRPDFEYLGRAVLALPTPGSCATWSIGTASSRPLMESHQEIRRVGSRIGVPLVHWIVVCWRVSCSSRCGLGSGISVEAMTEGHPLLSLTSSSGVSARSWW